MSRNVNKRSGPVSDSAGNAINRYLAALHEFYPASQGETGVVVRPDRSVIVTAPLPARAPDRMRLFDQMAEVGTRLLLETDQYIILSGR